MGIFPLKENVHTGTPNRGNSDGKSGGPKEPKSKAVPNAATKSRRQKYQSPLATIEFNAASDIIAYAETMRKMGRAEQLELNTAADELQALLGKSTGTVFERVVARRKAKKTANVLRKAGDHARGMAVMGVKLRRVFLGEYAPLIHPQRNKRGKVLNWKA